MRYLFSLLIAAVLCPGVARPKDEPQPRGKPGQKAPNFTLDDLAGRPWTLHDLQGVSAVVLYFTGTECPLANRYLGRLNDLSNLYFRKGVLVLAINPNGLDPVAAIAKHAKDYGLTVNVLLDRDQRVADQLGVELTPTAIVLDSTWKVRYRGLFDDSPTEAHVKKPYVRRAVLAILAGEDPEVTETEPWGCTIQRAEKETRSDVTYAGQIAPLLNRHCVSCHRPGEAGPFTLVGYEAARRWAKTIKTFTKSGRMPPWKPTAHGLFRDEMGLTEAEIAALARWADAGAPRGDMPPADPAPPPQGWALGEPDLVLEAPAYDVAADGDDEYRCFVLPSNRPADTWVRAVEVRPGNKQVVRHAVLFTDTSGAADKLAGAAAGYRSSGTWPGFVPDARADGWAPGRKPASLPDGVGWLLRRNARLVLQVHYHHSGRKETDRTRVGLYFAKQVKQPLRWLEVTNTTFQIPAGKPGQQVTAQHTLAEDVHALAVVPQMHHMGRSIKVEAEYPDRKRKVLLHIKEWDFHWQETYHFKSAEPLPRGTRLIVECTYDTSLDNPNTPPDLPKMIVSGKRTIDEACTVWIAYTRDGEDTSK